MDRDQSDPNTTDEMDAGASGVGEDRRLTATRTPSSGRRAW